MLPPPHTRDLSRHFRKRFGLGYGVITIQDSEARKRFNFYGRMMYGWCFRKA